MNGTKVVKDYLNWDSEVISPFARAALREFCQIN
jgi:hypothetical protein